MTKLPVSVAHLADAELLEQVRILAAEERRATARLVASLAELDSRRLYLGEGYSSLFTWCTHVLHLSEHAAYARIEAARAARRYPPILEMLVSGDIHLTAVGLLAPHLTSDNHEALLASARHKSKRDVERLIATLRPQPDAPSSVRKLPQSPPVRVMNEAAGVSTDVQLSEVTDHARASQPVRNPPPVLKPLAPERYKVQFTLSEDACAKLRRAQDLLRHSIPTGDVAEVFERALNALLQQLERSKTAAVERPRDAAGVKPRGRRIRAAVRREVWRRDEGRCAFVGTHGRCEETGFLEFHHVVPFAAGGPGDAANIQLRCRAHNGYEAEQWFGPSVIRENRATDRTRTLLETVL